MSFTQRLVNRLEFPTKHVLVCEDDLDWQSLIAKRFAEMFGGQHSVQLSQVPGGPMATGILGSSKVDLIILDHDMPHGNAEDFLGWLASVANPPPVLTNSGLDHNNARICEMWPSAHLGSKTRFAQGELDETIRRLLA